VMFAEEAEMFPVVMRFAPLMFPVKNPFPDTESFADGEVVPMPTFPLPLYTSEPLSVQ